MVAALFLGACGSNGQIDIVGSDRGPVPSETAVTVDVATTAAPTDAGTSPMNTSTTTAPTTTTPAGPTATSSTTTTTTVDLSEFDDALDQLGQLLNDLDTIETEGEMP